MILDGVQNCSYRVARNATTVAILLYKLKHFLEFEKDVKLTEGIDEQLHTIFDLILK